MSAPLRVTLPLLTLVPGHMGGSETYVRGLVDALGRRTDVEVTVIVPAAAAGTFAGVQEVVANSIDARPSASGRLRAIAKGRMAARGLSDAIRGAHVVHHPLIVPVPSAAGRPWVVTLLDVQHLDLPSMFSRAERLYRRLAYDATARRADRIVTISEFCKDRIGDRLEVAATSVDVAHLGVAQDWFQVPTVERSDLVYYPAAAWPHKNHGRLIEAMKIVRESHPGLRLVLTGQYADRLGALPSWVEHRGQVSRDSVRQLYSSASCVAFPSLYEGFGLPLLEAMATGCPVAASQVASIPEVCGDVAVLFDPYDPRSIANGITAAMRAGADSIARRREHARAFTWEACADAHVRSYAEAVRG